MERSMLLFLDISIQNSILFMLIFLLGALWLEAEKFQFISAVSTINIPINRNKTTKSWQNEYLANFKQLFLRFVDHATMYDPCK